MGGLKHVSRKGKTMADHKVAETESAACAHHRAVEAIEVSRRSFFASLLGMGAAAISAVVGLPLFRFIFFPVYASGRSTEWSNVGDAAEFASASGPVVKTVSLTQRDGWRNVVSNQSVYVNRTAQGKLQVLSAICPHLGCSVAWNQKEEKFICPCHGGQFAADGRHLSGPPPRGMDNLKAQVKDGTLQIQFEYFRSNVPDQELLS
jgi:menaquinol-cytochrome c reductase iron-sulfur subunit